MKKSDFSKVTYTNVAPYLTEYGNEVTIEYALPNSVELRESLAGKILVESSEIQHGLPHKPKYHDLGCMHGSEVSSLTLAHVESKIPCNIIYETENGETITAQVRVWGGEVYIYHHNDSDERIHFQEVLDILNSGHSSALIHKLNVIKSWTGTLPFTESEYTETLQFLTENLLGVQPID